MIKFYWLGLFTFLFSCGERKTIQLPEINTNNFHRFEDTKNIHVSWPKKNTLIYHSISEPDNLHPTNGNSSPRSEIIQYTQRALIYMDFENQSVVPGLVKSLPEISVDKLTYTYTLRDDVFWDDKSPLHSEDIVFTAKAFKCPLTNNQSVRVYWKNIKDIITYTDNPKKFTIVMKQANIQNVSFLTGFSILQRTFHDKKNVLSNYSFNQINDSLFTPKGDLVEWAREFNQDKYGRDPLFLNGLGMYNVTEWATGQYITITRKTDHWSFQSIDYREVSFPEKIIFLLNSDETSQLFKFKSQEIDVSTNLSMPAFLKLKSDEAFISNYNQELMPTFNYTYVCFNTKPEEKKRNPIFNDVDVRLAFAMLTPVDEIIHFQYKQFAPQCRRMVSNVSTLKKEFNNQLKPLPFNVSKAELLLKKAGWKDTDNDGILDKTIEGRQISLVADLNYIASSSDWKEIALLIAESMAKAGIKIKTVGMDIKLFLEKAKSHDFDLMLGSWGGTGLPEDYSQLWHTQSWTNHGSNYSGFGNQQTDSLIDAINLSKTDSIRFLLSGKLQQEIYNVQPYVFLYSTMRRNVIHKRFGNQLIFSERPGVLVNMLRLLSINKGITMVDEQSP